MYYSCAKMQYNHFIE